MPLLVAPVAQMDLQQQRLVTLFPFRHPDVKRVVVVANTGSARNARTPRFGKTSVAYPILHHRGTTKQGTAWWCRATTDGSGGEALSPGIPFSELVTCKF
jgi:hypothetical protein